MYKYLKSVHKSKCTFKHQLWTLACWDEILYWRYMWVIIYGNQAELWCIIPCNVNKTFLKTSTLLFLLCLSCFFYYYLKRDTTQFHRQTICCIVPIILLESTNQHPIFGVRESRHVHYLHGYREPAAIIRHASTEALQPGWKAFFPFFILFHLIFPHNSEYRCSVERKWRLTVRQLSIRILQTTRTPSIRLSWLAGNGSFGGCDYISHQRRTCIIQAIWLCDDIIKRSLADI